MERMLFEFVIRSTLIAAATGAVLALLRIRSAATRHAAWVGVIVAMLLLPAWMAWGPKASLPVLPARPAMVIDAAPEALPTAVDQGPAWTEASLPPAPKRREWDWSEALMGLYVLGALALLLRLAIGTVRARRLTSAAVSAPVTVGLVRPRIILPESAGEWSQAQLDAVMTHERAHARRRDPLFQWLALLNRAVFWFHPLAWWIEQRLAAFAEEACDAAVIEQGHDPEEYSMCLLEMARAVERAGTRVNVVAQAEGMTMPGVYLPARIKSIVAGVRAPRVSRTRLAFAALACAIPAAIFAAGTLDRAPQSLPLRPLPPLAVPPAPVLLAQATQSPAPAPARLPEFEVASVRLNPDPNYINATTPSLKIGGDQYLRFNQVTLRDLIMLAYGVGAGQVQGPGFLNGTLDNPADRFDINAKVPSGATPEQVPLMLRALLADRFHLSFHRDSKSMDIYALEVAKGGLKMKESPEGATGAARCARTVRQRDELLALVAACNRMTAADIAQQVQALAPGYFREGPIVDLTGLKGVYDFTLEWVTADDARNGAQPSMFDAVQEQLGLKLERRKQTVEILMIDKLDRTPTEN